MVNHTTFCEFPEQSIKNILDFIGLYPDNTRLQELYKIPQKQGNSNRYNLNQLPFTKEQIEFVGKMGFKP